MTSGCVCNMYQRENTCYHTGYTPEFHSLSYDNIYIKAKSEVTKAIKAESNGNLYSTSKNNTNSND